MRKSVRALILVLALCSLPVMVLADSMEDLAEELSDLSGRLSKKTIAVLPFEIDPGIDPAYGTYIAERLTHELVSEGSYAVVERSRVDRVFSEQKLSAAGAVSPETTVRIGQLLGVEAVVTGTATINAGKVEIFARIISVENALIIGSTRVQVATKDVPLRANASNGNQTNQVRPNQNGGTSSSGGQLTQSGEIKAEIGEFTLVQQNRTFHFHGYVHNTGKVAIAQPDISVQLFAADGSLLGIVRCFGDRYVLPGEKIPFRGIQLNVPANYARYTIDYTPAEEKYFTFLTDFHSDQVVFREAPGILSQLQLSGYVFNDTKETVKLLKIIIMLYDANGIYVGSAYGFAARKSVPAGESTPFQVNIMTYNLRAKPARYTLSFSALRDVQ